MCTGPAAPGRARHPGRTAVPGRPDARCGPRASRRFLGAGSQNPGFSRALVGMGGGVPRPRVG
eukprot:gene20668-biopygen5602